MPNLADIKLTRAESAALAAVIMIGLIHLAFPFDGDQALFTIGAAKISHGALLYRDFWDLKQPAIFIFYLAGGRLFGFNEVGIHAFELIYQVAFAFVLLKTLRGYFEGPFISALAPVLTIGFYYTVSGTWHLTQVESLVGFPLFLSLWFSIRWNFSGRGPHWRDFLLAGLFGGVVLLFKFVFAPLLLAFWLTALIGAVKTRTVRLSQSIRLTFALLCGVLLPLAITFVYFEQHGAIKLLAYTFFTYPSRALAEINSPVTGRLVNGLKWFLNNFAPLLALGFLGSFSSWKSKRDLLTINLTLWAVFGLLIIFIQRLSWWEYQYLLLSVPLGILAVKGLDRLWTVLGSNFGAEGSGKLRRLGFTCAIALLFSPQLFTLGLKVLVFAKHRFAVGEVRVSSYQDHVSDVYKNSRPTALSLAGSAGSDRTFFVCGNPVLYILSHREPAVASNGWMLELYLPEQWKQLEDELTAKPPMHIFVAGDYADLIKQRSGQISQLLNEGYVVVENDRTGTLYLRTGSAIQSIQH